MRRRLYVFFALCGGAVLVAAGCGDDDVCGVYNTGNVVIVDQCNVATVTPRPASANDLSAEELLAD